jgi:hypothetical protein
VSNFEPSAAFVPERRPLEVSTHQDPDEELLDFDEESSPREGLPSEFRMRHDAHYVAALDATADVAPVRLIPVAHIDGPHRGDAADLAPLIASIRAHGLLQPLLVRVAEGRFELIGGTRRLAAAIAAGLTTVPCLVHHVGRPEARALAAADNLYRKPAAVPPLPGHVSAALLELSQTVAALGSCSGLLSGQPNPQRERAATELLQIELRRMHWLLLGLKLLEGDPAPADDRIRCDLLMDRVVGLFDQERRVTNWDVRVSNQGPSPVAGGDESLLELAFAGAIIATLGAVRRAARPVLDISIRSVASDVRVSISQQDVAGAALEPARVWDVLWSERPGGYAAGVALLAARRIAELHRGALDAHGDATGTRIVLSLPQAIRPACGRTTIRLTTAD